jgi:hypothetical protein
MLICKENLVNKYHTGRCHEQEGHDLKWHLDSQFILVYTNV